MLHTRMTTRRDLVVGGGGQGCGRGEGTGWRGIFYFFFLKNLF